MTVPQSEFTQALLNPEQATPAGLVDPKGRPAGKRFDVYRNNVVTSLIDAMKAAFPVIEKLVGTEFFEAMAGVYVRQYPPTSPMLMFYGQEFPEFLNGFEPVGHLPYLSDIAILELARRTSYHAADAAPITAESLMEIPADQLMETHFTLAPSLILIESSFPIQSIWHFNMVDANHQIAGDPEAVLITRPEMDVTAHIIPTELSAFILALKSNQTLGEALEIASDIDAEFDLSAALGLLLGQNAITEITT